MQANIFPGTPYGSNHWTLKKQIGRILTPLNSDDGEDFWRVHGIWRKYNGQLRKQINRSLTKSSSLETK